MLARDGTPLQRRYFCPEHERDVPNDELVRGYEVAPGEHVIVTDEELEALAPRASRDIDLRRFVPVEEVDPFLFDSSYVLAPSGDTIKGYRLLAYVMEHEGRAGIATFVLRDKEYLVAIFARNGVLHAETLRFADEVRGPADAKLRRPMKVPRALVQGFERAIQAAEAELDVEALHDRQAARLREVVEEKRKRGIDVVEATDVAAEESPEAGPDPADLLEALKRSLAGGSRKPTAAKAPVGRQSRA